jgi:phosphatidylserine/phosphatidylglycerophosphate/cardiolipin synthase-like enzyme
LILRHIPKAQKAIKVQVYSFTSKEIAAALLKSQSNGIKIVILADKSQKTAVHSRVRAL